LRPSRPFCSFPRGPRVHYRRLVLTSFTKPNSIFSPLGCPVKILFCLDRPLSVFASGLTFCLDLRQSRQHQLKVVKTSRKSINWHLGPVIKFSGYVTRRGLAQLGMRLAIVSVSGLSQCTTVPPKLMKGEVSTNGYAACLGEDLGPASEVHIRWKHTEK